MCRHTVQPHNHAGATPGRGKPTGVDRHAGDTLSFHPNNLTGTLSDGLTFYNSAIKQLMKLREIMAANGDGEKLIWATEYGEPVVHLLTDRPGHRITTIGHPNSPPT